jgi:hypothetical protein
MMELSKPDLDDPRTWNRKTIIDQFIGDVLLPTNKSKSINVKKLYIVFVEYCNLIGFSIPCEKQQFGRHMATRFQKRVINGRKEYFCEVRPDLLEED